MILSELKTYVKGRGRVPMEDLVNHFRTDPDAIRGMLDHMIRKGRIRRVDTDAENCTGCNKCEAFRLEIYEWTG